MDNRKLNPAALAYLRKKAVESNTLCVSKKRNGKITIKLK